MFSAEEFKGVRLRVDFEDLVVCLREDEIGQKNVQERLHLDHREAHANAGLENRGSLGWRLAMRDTHPRASRESEQVGIETWKRLDGFGEMIPAVGADD